MTRPAPTAEQRAKRLIEVRKRQVEEAERQLERLLSRPKDTYADDTVIRFTKPGRFHGSDTRVLTYAAIKEEGHWFLTGMEQRRKTWEQLLDFIGEKNLDTIEVATFPKPTTLTYKTLHDSVFGRTNAWDWY